ncbi:MAG: fructose-specific PTS transporter subunit EIIC [Firmicutes bacterium]|nr:fructose-specific PTS transporter subunit EIIC [Bacillota bacterium]
MNRTLSSVKKNGIYAQIMAGIYTVIPLIILFSILAFIGQYEGQFFVIISKVSQYVFYLIVPLMSALIAMTIFGRFAFIPGFLIGLLSDLLGLGFLGGIASGLLVGYTALWIEYYLSGKHQYVKISFIVSMMISTMIGFVFSGLFIYFIFAPPVVYVLTFLMDLLVQLQSGNIIILVMILAGMTSFDLGGPVNKVAFSFVLAAYTSGLYSITGPALIAVTIPPLTMGLIVLIFSKRFSEEEKKRGRSSLLLSMVGITEGALPFAIKEPLRVIPAVVIGSMIGSGMAAYFQLTNQLMIASIGGLFGTNDVLLYLLCHLVGVVVSMTVYFILKSRK